MDNEKLNEQIETLNQKIVYLENLNTNSKIDYENQLNLINNHLNDLKVQHENEINEVNKANVEQLKTFESNFNLIQLENDELKYNDSTIRDTLKQYENEISQLKNQIDYLREQIDQNSILISQLNESKCQLDFIQNEFYQIQTENHELKSQLEQKSNLNETNYLDQLKQYEINFNSIQTENDELRAKLDEANIQVSQQNELKEKLNGFEQLNLKYKAKLKQLIAKSKLSDTSTTTMSHTNDLLLMEEQRSTNATPTSHSPMYHSPIAVVKTSTTQTDLNLDEIINRSSQLDIEISEMKTRLNQIIEEKRDLHEKNSKLESLKLEYENHIRQLNEARYEEKVENSVSVKSNSNIEDDDVDKLKEECQSLKERLETTQQQNLKLKAKLKNVLNSNKNEKAVKEHETERVK